MNIPFTTENVFWETKSRCHIKTFIMSNKHFVTTNFFACWPSGAPCQLGALRTSVSCLPVNTARLLFYVQNGVSYSQNVAYTTSENEYIHRIINISEYTPDTGGYIDIIILFYWHCPYSMWSKVYATIQCPSICPSIAGPQGYRPIAAHPHSSVAGECR